MRLLFILQLVAGKAEQTDWKTIGNRKNRNEHRTKIHTAMIKREKTKNVNDMDKNKNK